MLIKLSRPYGKHPAGKILNVSDVEGLALKRAMKGTNVTGVAASSRSKRRKGLAGAVAAPVSPDATE